MIDPGSRETWADRLDEFCAVTGALVPVGLVIGNIGFETMIGLVGAGWMIRLFLARENPFRFLFKHPLVLPWLALLLSIAVSLLINGPGGKGWAHDLVFFRFFLFFIALLDISTRKPVTKYFLWGLAAGVIWAMVNTLSAYILGFDFFGKPLIRYTGKLKEASRIAGMTCYASALFITWGILDRNLSTTTRSLLILIGIAAFAQMFQTRVRTSILSATIGLSFSIAYYIRNRFAPKPAIFVVVGIMGIVILAFTRNRMWDLTSIYDRIYYWKVVWAIWKEHPIFGVGISSYQDAYKAMAESGMLTPFIAPDGQVFSLSETTHAHNLVLMILSCTGILGLASFLWLFIRTIQRIFADAEGFRLALVSWPVVFLTIGLTGFNFFHSWYQALFGFFMVLIGSRWAEEKHG